jgi:murein DD-endopeptidase MepM/ murein hydrolase activator NlpD
VNWRALRDLGARPVELIVLDPRHGRDRRIAITPRAVAGVLAGTALALVAAGWGLKAVGDDYVDAELAREWRGALDDQSRRLTVLREEADATLGALTRRFGELQARLVRMEAVGQRLAGAAGVASGEFDFASTPALGGPDPGTTADDGTADETAAAAPPLQAMEPPAFVAMIDELTEQVLAREQQLSALESLLQLQRFERDVAVEGRPIDEGWLSSPFGRRVDPFHGKLAWHKGIDFAGDEGDPVSTVAAGVVTYAGERSGYGNLVEVNHGNGYVTRYGHSAEVLVTKGDVVRKGDVIATMGSTGRSTGPHVHFEVLRDGKRVDPARYVARGGS